MSDGPTPDTSTRYNYFTDSATGQSWVICWTPGDARAHLLKGEIYDKWMSLGGQQYGRVDGDTATDHYSQGNVYVQNFTGGPKIGTEFSATIVSTPWAGVHEMHGVVRDIWNGDGPNHQRGGFGFPVTDEIYTGSYYLDGGNILTAPFDGLGSRINWAFNITLNPVTGEMFVVYALDQDPGDGPADSWTAIDPHIVSQQAYWTSIFGNRLLDIYNAWYNGSGGNTGMAAQAGTAGLHSAAFLLDQVHSAGLLPITAYQPSVSFALSAQTDANLLASTFLQASRTAQPPPAESFAANLWNFSPDYLGALLTPSTAPQAGTPAQAPPQAGAQTQASAVPDFTAVAFALTDDSGAAHQLLIQSQAAQPDGSATFTAVWDGQSVTGTLAYDAAGNLDLTFNAADGSSFAGTVSGQIGVTLYGWAPRPTWTASRRRPTAAPPSTWPATRSWPRPPRSATSRTSPSA